MQAVAAVDEEQRQADDDGRQRERQVDERIEESRGPGTVAARSRAPSMIPSTVLMGTAMAVIVKVSQKAGWNAGRAIALSTGSMPPSNARKKTIPTGSASSSPRYSSTMPRTVSRATRDVRALPSTGRAPVAAARRRGGHAASEWRADAPADRSNDGQQQQRDDQQHDRHGGRGTRAGRPRLVHDVDRRDLGLERDVARDEHDRAELAHAAREAERAAGQDRRHQVGQDDPAGRRERRGAQRRGGLFHVAVQLQQHRLDRADHERQRHEQQGDRMPPGCRRG